MVSQGFHDLDGIRSGPVGWVEQDEAIWAFEDPKAGVQSVSTVDTHRFME